MDKELAPQCTSKCTGDEKVDEADEVTGCDESSRGGTRTHDPGIMSAVL